MNKHILQMHWCHILYDLKQNVIEDINVIIITI